MLGLGLGYVLYTNLEHFEIALEKCKITTTKRGKKGKGKKMDKWKYKIGRAHV